MHSSVWNFLEDLRNHHLYIQLLLFLLHVYLSVVYVRDIYICIFMYMLIHVYAPACGGLRLMLGLLLSHSPPYSLSHGLSIEPRSH